MKARVFISCGQQTEEEQRYSDGIKEYFETRGFEAYFADNIHSPQGLTTSIYQALRASEYFVALNLSRNTEVEFSKENKICDIGSLFVQQEIALASFLKLKMIAFHNKKVALIGVARHLHLNSIPINSVDDVLRKLSLLTKEWKAKTKNKLYPDFTKKGHLDVGMSFGGVLVKTNWWHVNIRNQSDYFNAKSCFTYIETIRDVNNKRVLYSKKDQKYELIWAGTGVTEIYIPARSHRDFDAIWTIQGQTEWRFNLRSSSTLYQYPILQPGTYQIIYVVMSDNFPITKISVKVRLNENTLTLIEQHRKYLYT